MTGFRWTKLLVLQNVSLCLILIGIGTQVSGQSPFYTPYYNNLNYSYGSSYNYNNQRLVWNDRNLQKKLDLTRTQRRDLSEIKIDYEDAIEDLQQEAKKLSAKRYTRKENGGYTLNKEVQDQITQINAQMKEVTNEFVAKADKILLPHQRETQKQIRFSQVIAPGFIKQLTSGALDSHLDISPAQKKQLKKLKKELDTKMRESIAKLMDEIKEELVDELDPAQRRRAREILKEYEYRNNPASFSILQYESYFFKKKKSGKR